LRAFRLTEFRAETTPTEKVKKLKRKAPPVEQDLMSAMVDAPKTSFVQAAVTVARLRNFSFLRVCVFSG